MAKKELTNTNEDLESRITLGDARVTIPGEIYLECFLSSDIFKATSRASGLFGPPHSGI